MSELSREPRQTVLDVMCSTVLAKRTQVGISSRGLFAPSLPRAPPLSCWLDWPACLSFPYLGRFLPVPLAMFFRIGSRLVDESQLLIGERAVAQRTM